MLRSNPYAPLCACAALLAAAAAQADPMLPDWTLATFDASSSALTNPYFPRPEGLLSIYEGLEDDTLIHVESLTTFETYDILGVTTRVVRDTEYEDDLLVEVADDWFAQDTDGNVWYFGEFVVNYNYDDDGNLIDTDNDGSWIADGVTNYPGIVMWNSPAIGDEYYQEYAPGVALDFARINALDDVVDIDFGLFMDVLHTSEGNLIDGPEYVENKLYAPGVGLVLIEELDDQGDPEFEIELIDQYFIPAPGSGALLGLGLFAARRRRRG